MSSPEVDAYITAQPEPQRSSLAAMRALLGELLPDAEEAISYGAPAWKVGGKALAGLSASSKHWSYLPHSGTVVATLGDALDGYAASKGAIKVPAGDVLPEALVAQLIAARKSELGLT